MTDQKKAIVAAISNALESFDEYDRLLESSLEDEKDFKLSIVVVVPIGGDRAEAKISGTIRCVSDGYAQFGDQLELGFIKSVESIASEIERGSRK